MKNKLLEMQLEVLNISFLIETSALQFLQHPHIYMLHMLQSFTSESLEQQMGESKLFRDFLKFSWSLNSQ